MTFVKSSAFFLHPINSIKLLIAGLFETLFATAIIPSFEYDFAINDKVFKELYDSSSFSNSVSSIFIISLQELKRFQIHDIPRPKMNNLSSLSKNCKC